MRHSENYLLNKPLEIRLMKKDCKRIRFHCILLQSSYYIRDKL